MIKTHKRVGSHVDFLYPVRGTMNVVLLELLLIKVLDPMAPI